MLPDENRSALECKMPARVSIRILEGPHKSSRILRLSSDGAVPSFGPVLRLKYQLTIPVIQPECKVPGLVGIESIEIIISSVYNRRKCIGTAIAQECKSTIVCLAVSRQPRLSRTINVI